MTGIEPGFHSAPEPRWKKILRPILDAFEWGDHEYLRAEFGKGIGRVWITIYEPRYRRGVRRLFPWRIRLCLVGPVRQLVWSRCTICGAGFSWSELRARGKESGLVFHMSGSVCHKDCALARKGSHE